MSRIRSLIHREPLCVLGFVILFTCSVFAVGAIGEGGGWMGIGRYDPEAAFQQLNPDFVYEKVAAELDGASSQISAAELRERLSDPAVYGAFADAAGVQDTIQNVVHELIDHSALIDTLTVGHEPHMEVRDGVLRDLEVGLSTNATRPLIVASLQGPSSAHWFGTDRAGRDVYALVVDGAWRPLFFGLFTLLIGGAAAVLAAGVAGLIVRVHGGALAERTIVGVLEGAQALPPLMVLLLIVFAGGGNNLWMILGLAMVALAPIYRSLDPSASRCTAPQSRRAAMLDPIMRNRIRLIRTLRNVAIAAVIGITLMEFFGLSSSSPSWGGMIANGRQFAIESPWMSLFPGIALTFVLFGVYALGHGLARFADTTCTGGSDHASRDP